LWLEFVDCAEGVEEDDVDETEEVMEMNDGRETVGGRVGVGKTDESELAELFVTSIVIFKISK